MFTIGSKPQPDAVCRYCKGPTIKNGIPNDNLLRHLVFKCLRVPADVKEQLRIDRAEQLLQLQRKRKHQALENDAIVLEEVSPKRQVCLLVFAVCFLFHVSAWLVGLTGTYARCRRRRVWSR